MSENIITAVAPSIEALRAANREAVVSGSDAEHAAARKALIEGFHGRALREEEVAYL